MIVFSLFSVCNKLHKMLPACNLLNMSFRSASAPPLNFMSIMILNKYTSSLELVLSKAHSSPFQKQHYKQSCSNPFICFEFQTSLYSIAKLRLDVNIIVHFEPGRRRGWGSGTSLGSGGVTKYWIINEYGFDECRYIYDLRC